MNFNLKSCFIEFRGIIVIDINRGNCYVRIVMIVIENVVFVFNDLEILVSYMLEIGKRYVRFNFKFFKFCVRVK